MRGSGSSAGVSSSPSSSGSRFSGTGSSRGCSVCTSNSREHSFRRTPATSRGWRSGLPNHICALVCHFLRPLGCSDGPQEYGTDVFRVSMPHMILTTGMSPSPTVAKEGTGKRIESEDLGEGLSGEAPGLATLQFRRDSMKAAFPQAGSVAEEGRAICSPGRENRKKRIGK